jgi:hypothetical protein
LAKLLSQVVAFLRTELVYASGARVGRSSAVRSCLDRSAQICAPPLGICIALLVGCVAPSALTLVGLRLGKASQCTKAIGKANNSSFTHKHYNGLSCRQVHIVGWHRETRGQFL